MKFLPDSHLHPNYLSSRCFDFFFKFLFNSILCICMIDSCEWRFKHAMTHVWRSKDNLGSWLSPSTFMGVPEINLSLPSLHEEVLWCAETTCWPLLLGFCYHRLVFSVLRFHLKIYIICYFWNIYIFFFTYMHSFPALYVHHVCA